MRINPNIVLLIFCVILVLVITVALVPNTRRKKTVSETGGNFGWGDSWKDWGKKKVIEKLMQNIKSAFNGTADHDFINKYSWRTLSAKYGIDPWTYPINLQSFIVGPSFTSSGWIDALADGGGFIGGAPSALIGKHFSNLVNACTGCVGEVTFYSFCSPQCKIQKFTGLGDLKFQNYKIVQEGYDKTTIINVTLGFDNPTTLACTIADPSGLGVNFKCSKCIGILRSDTERRPLISCQKVSGTASVAAGPLFTMTVEINTDASQLFSIKSFKVDQNITFAVDPNGFKCNEDTEATISLSNSLGMTSKLQDILSQMFTADKINAPEENQSILTHMNLAILENMNLVCNYIPSFAKSYIGACAK